MSFDVTIPELCAEVGKSRRTLEYAFRESTGTSPARYFQLCRLREAFLELAAARQTEVDVTTVATNWGFFDLGRFARDFRASFGELPSETLKRDPGRSPTMPALLAL